MRSIGNADDIPFIDKVPEIRAEDWADLISLTGSLGASMLQGRDSGGTVLNLLGAGIGTGFGLGASVALTNGKPSGGVRLGSSVGGAALGHLITNYLTDLFLETPRERELRIKGLEYAVEQDTKQQSNQPIQ